MNPLHICSPHTYTPTHSTKPDEHQLASLAEAVAVAAANIASDDRTSNGTDDDHLPSNAIGRALSAAAAALKPVPSESASLAEAVAVAAANIALDDHATLLSNGADNDATAKAAVVPAPTPPSTTAPASRSAFDTDNSGDDGPAKHATGAIEADRTPVPVAATEPSPLAGALKAAAARIAVDADVSASAAVNADNADLESTSSKDKVVSSQRESEGAPGGDGHGEDEPVRQLWAHN